MSAHTLKTNMMVVFQCVNEYPIGSNVTVATSNPISF